MTKVGPMLMRSRFFSEESPQDIPVISLQLPAPRESSAECKKAPSLYSFKGLHLLDERVANLKHTGAPFSFALLQDFICKFTKIFELSKYATFSHVKLTIDLTL